MGERLIGVDVGGTKVSVAVLEDGILSDPVLQPTEQSSSEALVAQLAAAIDDAGPADAVGIGVPSVIDFATGTARTSVNIPLQGVPLRQQLTERLGIPVFVDNDATVAALAEAHDDDLNLLAESLVMITVGTGVGGGIVIGGRIYRGVTGAAPELGHILIGADLTDGAPPAAERQPHHA
jgi:glucokinase